MPQEFKLRSSIHSSLKRAKLLRGTFMAGSGVSLLVYCGAFLSLPYLAAWGLPIFCLGVGVISWGLIPYRRLNRLETRPHLLVLDSEENLQVNLHGKKTMLIPKESVERLEFLQKDQETYGMGVWLKDPLPRKIVVFGEGLSARKFRAEKFQEKSRRIYGCDLFLPYFSKRSCDELVVKFIED